MGVLSPGQNMDGEGRCEEAGEGFQLTKEQGDKDLSKGETRRATRIECSYFLQPPKVKTNTKDLH